MRSSCRPCRADSSQQPVGKPATEHYRSPSDGGIGLKRSVAPILLLGLLALSSCIESRPLGPDVGACANIPDVAYGYGEPGIGTCLAGPSDLQFVTVNGQTRLLVSNADPYWTYSSGSILSIDWSSIDFATAGLRLEMHEVPASAITWDEDRFFGQIGVVSGRSDGATLALVGSRFSQDSTTSDVDDQVRVLDLSDPNGIIEWREGGSLTVGADPYHIAVTDGRAYISNLSESFIQVLDVGGTPFEAASWSGGGEVLPPVFVDNDLSGSRATIYSSNVDDPSLLISEDWQLSWEDAVYRSWVIGASGVDRIDIIGDAVSTAVTNPVIDASLFDEPVSALHHTVTGNGSALWIATGGSLFFASNDAGEDAWSIDVTAPILRGNTPNVPGNLDSPSVFVDGGTGYVAFDIREDGGAASIGLGQQLEQDGAWEVVSTEVLRSEDGSSFEDPSVWNDPFTGGPRMWLSVNHSDGTWSIAESRSQGVLEWDSPTSVSGLDGSVASPHVQWHSGRYWMLFVRWDDVDARWGLWRAQSINGLDWEDAAFLYEIAAATDAASPPRPAVFTSDLSGFSVAGESYGTLSGLAVEGTPFTAIPGVSIETSVGFVGESGDLPGEERGGALYVGPIFDDAGAPSVVFTLENAAGSSTIYSAPLGGSGVLLDRSERLLPEEWSEKATSPAIHVANGQVTLIFADLDEEGTPRMRLATGASTDSLSVKSDAVAETASLAGNITSLQPGALETTEDGTLELWFAAESNGTYRIGILSSSDDGATFSSPSDSLWAFDVGAPGAFDDAGVRDPRLFDYEGQTWMSYAGFDGEAWRVGLVQLVDGRPDPSTRRSTSLLPNVDRTFFRGGTRAGTAYADENGLKMLFSGVVSAGDTRAKLGMAVGSPEAMFPAMAVPTRADRLTLSTRADGGQRGEIGLTQAIGTATVSAAGLSGMRVDDARGMLYITSKVSDSIIAVDTRMSGDGIDGNVNDIEGLLRVRTTGTRSGFRDVIPSTQEPLLYAVGGEPDSVMVLDADALIDDERKQVHEDVLLGVLPLRTAEFDAGNPGAGRFSGSTMALREQDGRRHLFVPQFRDNSLSVFDLDRGEYGELVGYIPNIGENPHVARLSPDGKYVVVAAYLGDVTDGVTSSTLTVVDADPASETFLQTITTLVNR